MSSTRPPEIVLPERYQVLRHLADGGMASVWCAWDSLLHRKVAVKVLGGPYLHDRSAAKRFSREARAGARLSSHPNIVTIYDVGVGERPEDANARDGVALGASDGPVRLPFIVMEHLIGGTVGDAIRLGSVSSEQALGWIRQAAAGLDYAHRHGVVHGDIKPGNLLLDGEHTVHVSDFGLARILSDEDAGAPERFGTAAYLSPEQAAGAAATPASDRYALGVVAFELLTGTRPFQAEPSAAVIRHHRDSAVPAASSRKTGLPRALDEVFTRALAKQEAERWPSAMEFAAATERALVKRHLAGWKPWRVSMEPVRRRHAAAVAAMALAASVAGVGIGISQTGAPAPGARVQHHVNVATRPVSRSQDQRARRRHAQRHSQQVHAVKSAPPPLIPIFEGPVQPAKAAPSRPAGKKQTHKRQQRQAPRRAPRPPRPHAHPGGHAAPGAGPAALA